MVSNFKDFGAIELGDDFYEHLSVSTRDFLNDESKQTCFPILKLREGVDEEVLQVCWVGKGYQKSTKEEDKDFALIVQNIFDKCGVIGVFGRPMKMPRGNGAIYLFYPFIREFADYRKSLTWSKENDGYFFDAEVGERVRWEGEPNKPQRYGVLPISDKMFANIFSGSGNDDLNLSVKSFIKYRLMLPSYWEIVSIESSVGLDCVVLTIESPYFEEYRDRLPYIEVSYEREADGSVVRKVITVDTKIYQPHMGVLPKTLDLCEK